ncbi:carcinine transporter-like isoform X1 [Tachypleus tridentatus]|uniref:carcinine transporter-like isoform X1 n=1 Tax=Tachypleus tridentatus TaxID=6853 RepID=UPI003FD5C02D
MESKTTFTEEMELRAFSKSKDEDGNHHGLKENGSNKSKGKAQFEDILTDVGEYGIFQKRLLYWFMFPISIPISWVAMNQVFILSVPDHWCHIPELTTTNLSVWHQLRLVEQQYGQKRTSRCEMYNFNYSSVLLEMIENPNLNITSSANLSTQPCQNGWVYDQTLYDSTASTKWDLVCDKDHFPNLIFTLFSAGGAAATPVYGAISDRIGRKLTFYICVAVTVVSGVISMVVSNFTIFAVLRLVNGSLNPTIYQTSYIILVEVSGIEKRTRILALLCISWTLGLCILPLLAFLCRNWRIFGLVTTCSLIPFFFFWRILPESPRWLISVGRYNEAVVILKEIAATNGNSEPNDLVARLMELEKTMKEEEKAQRTAVLLKYPRLRKHFLIITLAWIASSVTYYALQLNVTNLYGNEFLNFFLLGLVELPTYFICWYLMEKIGRRLTNVSLFMLAAVSSFLPVAFPSDMAIGTTIGALVGKFGCSAGYMVMYQQATELYPTPVRALGMGISATMASIFLIATPYLIYLGTYNQHIPYVIIGGICLATSFTGFFLPETLHAKLPQTLEDGEEYGNNQKYCSCFRYRATSDEKIVSVVSKEI